jgi:hypothetical protein
MAAKNVNMADAATVEKEPIKPSSFGELMDSLKQATNCFISHHIYNTLSSFIKNSHTVQHILSVTNTIIKRELDFKLDEVCDLLAPYTQLDTLAEEHIMANGWKDGDEFAEDQIHHRFSSGKERMPVQISSNNINSTLYKNYVIKFFQTWQARKNEENLANAKKMLGELSGTQATPKTASRFRSWLWTPNSSRSRSRSHTPQGNNNNRLRKRQKRPVRNNNNNNNNNNSW